MKRWLVLACALLVGAVAPARAWCEATCLAPAPQAQSHCPSHEPADGTTSMSATVIDDCPVLESARPTAPARLELAAAVVTSYVPAPPARTGITAASARPHGATTVLQRSIPLRI